MELKEATHQFEGQQQSKKHFEILDGLRGVAALEVVVFHFMEWVAPDISKNFISHGFLAVDFFFCLSGFVIAYAYDNRIRGMGWWAFLKARLIRLHPLVVLGAVLGILAFFFDPFAPAPAYNPGRLILLMLSSLLLIPLPIMEERFFNLFAFNAPAWSLFWEYVANLFYAFLLYKLPNRILLVLTIVAAAVLLYVSFRAGNLLGGWSKDTFWDGGARVAYSFMAGLLLYRYRLIIKNKIGFLGLSFLLALAFIMPWTNLNRITEAVVAILYFPLIVSLGAGSSLLPRVVGLCRFSGNISYPLYMTHYAIIWSFGNYFTQYKPGTTELILVIVGCIFFQILVAYLAMRFYDLPVRRYLSRRWR